MKNQIIQSVIVVASLSLFIGGVSYLGRGKDVYAKDEAVIQTRESDEEEFLESAAFDAAAFTQYETFGMVYHPETNRFYYEGKLVRYFKDTYDTAGNINGFSHTDGEVDIIAARDENFKLTGLKLQSEEEFHRQTDQINEIGSSMNGDTAHEEGDSGKDKDDSLAAYEAYGISYDAVHDLWNYKGETVHAFYDEGHQSYISGDEPALKSNLNLIVQRDTKGEITKIAQMNDTQYKKIFE